MKVHHLTAVIRLRAAVFGLKELPVRLIERNLSANIADHVDGRWLFSVEMIQQAFARLIEGATYHAVEQTIPDEGMETTPTGSQISIAIRKAEEACTKLRTHANYDLELFSLGIEAGPEDGGGWCVLSREDRRPDGTPGPYTASGKTFSNVDKAEMYAGTVSTSRRPIVVREEQKEAVLVALNGWSKR